MNPKSKSTRSLLLLATIFTAGCSCFVPWNQRVTIGCSDPKAQIFVDNMPVGTGHAEVELLRNRGHSVVASDNGKTIAAGLGNRISIAGDFDLVGGILFGFPFIGGLFPGFFDIEPSNIYLVIPGTTMPAPYQLTPPPQPRN